MTSQLSIDYVKRKNIELFEKMKNKKIANCFKDTKLCSDI